MEMSFPYTNKNMKYVSFMKMSFKKSNKIEIKIIFQK